MRNTILFIMLFFLAEGNAETIFNIGENTVTSGKVTINGKEVDLRDRKKGSGTVATITRPVTSFSGIRSYGSFDVFYRKGPFGVEISGDDNLLGLLSTHVVGGELRLSIDKGYSTDHAIVVKVSSPILKSVKITGSSDVTLKDVNAEHLLIDLRGAVDMTADGKVSHLTLRVQGTGDVAAKSLIADFVDIDMQGAGDVVVTARKELMATLVGLGDITYYGRPAVIKKNISGMGDLEAGD